MVAIAIAAPPMVLSEEQEDNPIVECVPVSPMQQDQKKPMIPQGVTTGKHTNVVYS